MIYNALAVSYGNCGTSQFQAHLAANALIIVHLEGSLMLNIFEKCAWTA